MLGLNALAIADERMPVLAQDPIFAPAPQDPSREVRQLNLRLIRHGLGPTPSVLDRQLLATERILSQCPGLEVRIQLLADVETGYTTLQDRFEEFDAKGSVLTQSFFGFFLPWMESRPPASIDVHWVDHLDAPSRQEYQRGEQVSVLYLGQSYNRLNMERLYRDSRPEDQQAPRLAQLAGDTLVLATNSLRSAEGRLRVLPEARVLTRHSSLLAHELGHLLFEEQTGEGGYRDHYCPEAGGDCPSDNVMVSGGYEDLVYLAPPFFRRVMGYSPLPKVDSRQCQALRAHPLLLH